MFPALPFGPLTLPTGPFFVLFAAYFGLDAAARMGKRLGLRTDDVWNTGMLALLAGVLVARLWNVFQFWYVYAEEPLLIFSLRPSGFAFWPGLIAALMAAYAYMLRAALHPAAIVGAFAPGVLTAGVFLNVGDYLTGALTGLPSDLPWALPYYGEMQHPVGLYRAVGLILVLIAVWIAADPLRPQRTAYLAGLGWGLVHLLADGFAANAPMIGPFRTSQLVGLVIALVCAALLAFDKPKGQVEAEPPLAEPPLTESPQVGPPSALAPDR
jgi:phosphatidylglycerol:prolipoprotein diacylglycerol transferase